MAREYSNTTKLRFTLSQEVSRKASKTRTIPEEIKLTNITDIRTNELIALK